MKSFFFVVPSKGRISTMLRTTLFERLLREPNTHIVIFSPFANDSTFTREFSGPTISHESLEPVIFSKGVRIILRIRDALLKIDSPILIKSSLIMQSVREGRVIEMPPPRQKVLATVRMILRPFRPLFVWLFNLIEQILFYQESYARACKTYNPKGIIVGTLGIVPQDLAWLVHAHRFAIPAYAIDLPWNYFEDKMLSLPRPAHACVWNTSMAKRAEEEFAMPQAVVHITGCMRYDFYTRFKPQTREIYASRIHADPSRPLIAFFLGMSWHKTQEEVVRTILEAIRSGQIPGNPQLLIRFGPGEKPNSSFEELRTHYKGDLIFNLQAETPSQEDVANIIYYSAVTVSHYSSTGLDAAVLNRPHMYIGFSGYREPHESDALLAHILEFDYVRPALETGGVQAAYTSQELLSYITEGFTQPEKYEEGRKKMVTYWLGEADGKAGERIANVILNEI